MLRSCPARAPSHARGSGGDSAGFRQPPARTHRALPEGLLLSPRARSHPKHGVCVNTGPRSRGGQGDVSTAGLAGAGRAKLLPRSPSVLPALGPSLATGKPCFQARFWQLSCLDEETLHRSGRSQSGSTPALSWKEGAVALQAAPVWRAICFP